MLGETLAIAGSVVVPDQFTRVVDFFKKHGEEYRHLARAVEEVSGFKPGSSYKAWFMEDDTWDMLMLARPDHVSILVEKLDKHMGDRNRAQAMVDATLLTLVQSLDPARGIAVVGARLQQDITELKDLIIHKDQFQSSLKNVVPPARQPLEALYNIDPVVAGRLMSIATQQDNHEVSIKTIAAQPPIWLESAPTEAWTVLAELANGYGINDLYATLLEKIASFGISPAKTLARAAYAAAKAGQNDRTEELVARAKSVDSLSPDVLFYSAALSSNAEAMLQVGRNLPEVSFEADVLLAEAVLIKDGISSGITEYRRVVAQYPEYAGIRLRLVQLLRNRQEQPTTNSFAEMLDLALEARDLRRKWRGDSGEAVGIACTLEFDNGNLSRVIELGRPSPDGLARREEASNPTVLMVTGEAALKLGRLDLAKSLLSEIKNGFDRSFFAGRYYAASGSSTDDVASMYMAAWDLAEFEHERIAVWSVLADIGHALPERAKLEAREDVQSAVIIAKYDSVNGYIDDAIATLRPWRNRSIHVIHPLVSLYLEKEDSKAAAETLRRAAERFNDARLLVDCAQLMTEAGNLAGAAEMAKSALATIGDEPHSRVQLHGILIQDAQSRGAWREMEQRIRALIGGHGPTSDRRWWLIGALYNQRQMDAAWEVMGEGEVLDPNTEDRAKLWIELNTRFRSDELLADEMLALVDRFEGAAGLAEFAVGHFLSWKPHHTLEGERRTLWRSRIQDLIEDGDSSEQSIFTVKLPSDPSPEELIEALRPFLEPGAAEKEDIRRQVTEGQLPYGMISAITGKTYAAALVARAAGHLTTDSVNESIAHQDLLAARAAVNKSTVIDISSLVVISSVRGLWPILLRNIDHMTTTVAARSDVVRAVGDFNPEASGTISWDIKSGRPVVSESDQLQIVTLRETCEWIASLMQNLDVVDWPTLQHLSGDDMEMRVDDRFLPWLSPLEYAIENSLPLYSDDLVLRSLARSMGVASFGSHALMISLNEIGAVTSRDLFHWIDEMRAAYCVDLPYDAISIHRLAHRDQWKAGPGAYVFSRSATWVDGRRAFATWHAMLTNVAVENPDQLPNWLYYAILGSARHRSSLDASRIASMLLFDAAIVARADSTAFTVLVNAARAAASELRLADLLPTATTHIFDMLSEVHGAEEGARRVLGISSKLHDVDRLIVRNIVFGVRS